MSKLVLEVPEEQIQSAVRFAKQHETTVDELVARYLQQLGPAEVADLHPAVQRLTGILPSDLEPKEAYLQAVLEKHS